MRSVGIFDFTETRWGDFCSLAHAVRDEKHTKVKVLHIKEGQNISYQMHLKRSEIWHVSKGSGIMVVGDVFFAIKQGDAIAIDLEQWHAVKALEDLEIFEIQYGDATEEDDIERKYYDWNDIIKVGVRDDTLS